LSIQPHSGLAGVEVRVNRGGPESVTGTLVAVMNDVLAVKPPTGPVIYFNLEHVKSVTPLANADRKRTRAGLASAVFPPWLTFRQVLSMLSHRYVQINRGGPEKVEGVIAGVTDNTVTLVSGKEVVRIAIHHIRTVNLLASPPKGGKSKR